MFNYDYDDDIDDDLIYDSDGDNIDDDAGENYEDLGTASQPFQALGAESDIKLILDEENTQTHGLLSKLSIETRKREISGLISKTRADIGKAGEDNELLTVPDIVDVIFGAGGKYSSAWFKRLIKRLTHVTSTQVDRSEVIKSWEIEAFVEAILKLHIYHVSPTALWQAPAGWYKLPLLSHARFSFIMNKLDLASKDNNAGHSAHWTPREIQETLPDVVAGFRELASQCRDLIYDKEITTISLDDEKEQMRSKDVPERGLSRIYQRSGNPGPTLYEGVSKNSGVLLSAEFQTLGESTQVCAKRTIAMAVGNSLEFDHVNLGGTILASDRGVNQASLLYELVDRGVKISGTVPRSKFNKDPAFASFSNRAAMTAPTAIHGAHDILEHGTRSSYWAKKGNLYYLAVRQGHGRSIVYLATSDPDLAPGTYILERANIHHQRSNHVYQRDGSVNPNPIGVINTDCGCLNYFKNELKLRFLTERQAEALWFLFRNFRITSTVSRKVLTTIRHHVVPIVDSGANDLRMHELLEELGELLSLGEAPEHAEEPLDHNFENYKNMNVDALKKSCKSLEIARFSKLNREGLLNAIETRLQHLETNPSEIPNHSPLDAVLKAFFECWFLEPMSSTPAMVEGSSNEKKVIKGIADFFVQNSPHPDKRPAILEITTIGLALCNAEDSIATSVDGLFSIFSAEDENTVVYGSIEIKTHLAAGQQTQLIRSLGSKYGNICATAVSNNIEMYEDDLDIFFQDFGSNKTEAVPFAEVILNHEHRSQIIHHASTLDLPIVLFVDATPTEIFRIVVVYVCEDVRESYRELLSLVTKKYLGWVYIDKELPTFSDSVLGFCADQHTLQLTLNLWRAAHDLFKSRGEVPFPPIKKINPALTTSWNRTKGGVDIDTRYKANNAANYQHLGVEPRLWDLMIIEAALNAARIYKWCKLENNLVDIKTTDKLKYHFNSSSSNEILMEIACAFRQRAEDSQRSQEITRSSSASSGSRTTNPPVTKWTQTYFASPRGIQQRTENIDHIFLFDKKESKSCSDCGTMTRYYCRHCNNARLCVVHHKDTSATDGLTCYERFHNPENMVLHHPKLLHNKESSNNSEPAAPWEQGMGTSNTSDVPPLSSSQPASVGTKRSSTHNDSSDSSFKKSR